MRANFAFDDQFILSGSDDGYVYLWDIKKGTLAGRLGTKSQSFGHLMMVNEVASVGSNIIVSAGDDHSCIVWELEI